MIKDPFRKYVEDGWRGDVFESDWWKAEVIALERDFWEAVETFRRMFGLDEDEV